MLLLFPLLQAEIQPIAEIVQDKSSNAKEFVIISVVTYLICALIQYVLNLFLKKKDISNDRSMKIADLSIEKEIELYRKLEHLRTYQKGEGQALLSDLEFIRELLNSNRLLYKKRIYSIADKYADYFSTVCTDYSRRDINKELRLLEEYRNLFYGE